MKLTEHQFIEAAFIFEKDNGSQHGNYEKKVIKESNLFHYNPLELKAIMVSGLNEGIYINKNNRASVYWALSKTNDKNLIADYKRWLKMEFDLKNETAIFQILIALDRLGEPVFHKERNSRYFDDIKLNLRDAKNYLNRQ